MKKAKFIKVSVLIVLFATLALTFFGCKGEPKHEHSFNEEIIATEYLKSEATCLQKAVYYKSCECGEKGTGTFEYGVLKSHSAASKWEVDVDCHWHLCATNGCSQILDKEPHAFDKNKQCIVCGYVNTALSGTEISSTVYEIDGTNLFVKVPNKQTTFYFGDSIKTADGATFKVYENIKGTVELSTYMSDLTIGDNYFYITVSKDGFIPKTYTANIRRKPMYTVTFNCDDGTEVENQIVEEDDFVVLPLTEKAGYDFVEWDYDSSNPITQDTTISATFSQKPEMSNFTFTSKGLECTITGIIDKTVMEVVIPYSVTSIGSDAFYGCSSLTSVTIPDSVTSIGDRAFYGCTSLTEINYNAVNCADLSSNNNVFYKTGQNGEGIKVTIGKDVEKIPAYLFHTYHYYYSLYAPKITEIVFEEGSVCESIGDCAFYNCSSLQSITIPDSVTSIGSDAFYACSNLTSITIPDSVTSIGEYAFYNCYKLVEVINKSSLDITKGSNDNGYVAYYALNVKNEGTSDIVNVNDYLFIADEDNVNYLLGYVGNDTELVLPDNYKGQNYEIYEYAFYYSMSLTSITIPDSVTSIGSSAFSHCSSLTSITIPDSVTSIGYNAFGSCYSLTSFL